MPEDIEAFLLQEHLRKERERAREQLTKADATAPVTETEEQQLTRKLAADAVAKAIAAGAIQCALPHCRHYFFKRHPAQLYCRYKCKRIAAQRRQRLREDIRWTPPSLDDL